MLREVKFYARDILRGPNAKTPFGFFASGLLLLPTLALLILLVAQLLRR